MCVYIYIYIYIMLASATILTISTWSYTEDSAGSVLGIFARLEITNPLPPSLSLSLSLSQYQKKKIKKKKWFVGTVSELKRGWVMI